MTRSVETLLTAPAPHWVGDGFPVRSIFSPRSVGSRLSPFILLDYAGPVRFEPSAERRGVDVHPHRGFETVTVVYEGELEHRDSAGNAGRIGPGDVQWMTAGSGVLHEEKHSREFSRHGGVLEMAQLWVNLPAREKMTPPRYQELNRDRIPTIDLPDGAGRVRVIAGAFDGVTGSAHTVTPVLLWDVRLSARQGTVLPVPEGFSAAIVGRRGACTIAGTHRVTPGDCAVMQKDGAEVAIRADEETELLLLGGAPIDEPVVAEGPFVMNSQEEIHQAIDDLRAGRFGRLA